MGKIQVLDVTTVNKIAAGEVVERPASAVKEMVENAIDAGANKITVEIKNGGISFIRVTDNGGGIAPEDVETAFLPHATSKIRSIDDLNELYTMGFRGEALASIAAVSKVQVLTKTKDATFGTALEIEGGQILSKSEAGCPDGTTIVVENLFFNTPARMHFLKKDSAEAAHVTDVLQKMALGYPQISFRLLSNGREVFLTPGTGDLKDVLPVIFGNEIASKMVEVDLERDGVTVKGYIGLPEVARNNRTMQNFFVNGRWVKSKEMQFSAEAGYKTMLMTGKRPILVLSVSVLPMLTDVNVHPQKLEIKFANEKLITSAVFWAVQEALLRGPKARQVESTAEVKSTMPQPDKKPEPVSFNVIHKKETPAERYEKEEKSFDFFAEENKALFTVEPKAEVQEDFFGTLEEPGPIFTEMQPEAQPEMVEAPSDVLDFKICGQVFNTYIIFEKDGEMLMMDQHAAHERLRYEEMVKDMAIPGQLLMLPEMITLSATDGALLLENKEAFEKLGFDIDAFGAGQYAVRQIPEDITTDHVEETVTEIIELIRHNKKAEDILDKAFFMIACKGAIKANHAMQKEEMELLVRLVLENDRIRTCPHGRPLMISFTKNYIEKEFKRIV